MEALLDVTDAVLLIACLFVTSVLMFHVALMFIFGRRWQAVTYSGM